MAVVDGSDVEKFVRDRISKSVATDEDLDGVDLRVYLYLTSRLDFLNAILIPHAEMIVALGKRKEHVSRAMRKLAAKGIILPGQKVGRSVQWRLNPDYGKKGSLRPQS